MLHNAGLILEGGGMRGAYTAGILDFFLDKEIDFTSCYGVSAGACHACSYLSKQRGRAFRVSVEYLGDKRYCSVYSLLKTGDLFGAEFTYKTVPNELDPFDYEALQNSATDFYAVVTNVENGKAEYLPVKQRKDGIRAVRASSSLPLLARIVEIDGKKYLDGGVSDSIPIRRSIEDGNERNVVILTQCDTYRKQPTRPMRIIKMKYRHYPAFVKSLSQRHQTYNDTVAFVEREAKAGRAFIIRPKEPVTIGRVEKDRQKLESLYKTGYSDAAACYEDLMRFLEGGNA